MPRDYLEKLIDFEREIGLLRVARNANGDLAVYPV